MVKTKYIRVWAFEDAPQYLQKLSPHGGDEDWLALVPMRLMRKYPCGISWLEAGTQFGCCDVSKKRVGDHYVFIGAHS